MKILQVIVILQWNLVLINSDKNVTKRNVQEFSDVVSNPCEPIVSPMLKPQASVTCQHGCSTDCQPQNVSSEHIFLEVVKFLSQLITKFYCVITGSLPKEGKNAHSPDAPMFSHKGQVNCEKSLNENVSQGVSKTEETEGKK